MTGHLLTDPTFRHIGIDPARQPCFYCGEVLASGSGGAILWHGAGSVLCLHQGCAESLAVRLIQDAAVVKLQSEQVVKLYPSEPQRNPARYHLTRLE